MREEVQLIPWNAPFDDKDGLLSRCQRCDARFQMDQSRVIEKVGADTHLVHVRCQACNGTTLMTVKMDNDGIVVSALSTDLLERDLPRALKGEKIGIDDVTAAHFFLNDQTPGRDFIDEILDRS